MTAGSPRSRLRQLAWFVPLLLFLGLALFMARNLGRPQQAVIESRMVGHPLPPFQLRALGPAGVEAAMGREQVVAHAPVMLNLFASWCRPCAAEAPQLKRLAEQGVRIIGIAVQDRPDAIRAFLARTGNPYAAVLDDADGRMLVQMGASGVPETFIVGRTGTITWQHIGEIRAEHVPPLVARLGAAR
jgi:cytochrome c biogenesis protein CcmG/thiol:disulfide interchange protein DsbE